MRNRLLWGAACAVLGLVAFGGAARSATLDDVMARLDKIEKENAELRQKIKSLSAAKAAPAAAVAPAVAVAAPASAKPTVTGLATPPRILDAPEIDANGHGFLEHKKGNPLTFYTPGGEITGYGNIDVSIDDTTKSMTNFDLNGFSPPVGNFGWMPAI